MSSSPLHKVRAGTVTGYQVGSRLFPRKDDLLALVQQILHTTPLGAPVAETDLAFLLDLLAHHPDARRKIGAGIVAMEVRINPKYRTSRCFWAVRRDGSETDWSFTKCIYPTTTMKLLGEAFRHVVLAQTQPFKQAHFAAYANAKGEVLCPVERIWVAERDAHVDHIPPLTMEQLILDFLGSRQRAPEDIVLSSPSDGSIGRTLADPALARDWRAYHREHARLRVVSWIANLSTIRRTHRSEQQATRT